MTDQCVPNGAPWSISDDTGNMVEIRFVDSPGVGVMLYKGVHRALCTLFEAVPMMTSQQARGFALDVQYPERTEPQMVMIDRARFERLRETAKAAFDTRYVTCFSPLDGPVNEDGMRLHKATFALRPGDLDPLP